MKISKVDLSAAKVVAIIGALVAICVGILYLISWNTTAYPALYILAGITNLAGRIIVFLIVGVINLKVPIPYTWWILLAIGAAIVVTELLVRFLVGIFPTAMYLGGVLIGLAGLVELLIGGGKLSWSASKFVLLVGAAASIAMKIISWDWVWSIVAIALCVVLILMLFDVIPNKWWYVLGVGIAVLLLPISFTAGAVILVGFILVLMDK